MTERSILPGFEYGVESVELRGESASGDLHIVREISAGILIGVIDGLGHGTEAAAAAQAAANTIDQNAEEPIIDIVRACDEKLRTTRGAVMALASIDFNDQTLAWLTIGSVEGFLLKMNPNVTPLYESFVMQPGVVGYHLHPLSMSVTSIAPNDLMVFSTDGVRSDYAEKIAADLRFAQEALNRRKATQAGGRPDVMPSRELAEDSHDSTPSREIDLSFVARGEESFSPQNLASYICRNYSKGSDDALVLVAKYLGRR